jgi:membrane protease YdiL (CAAX protease family)
MDFNFKKPTHIIALLGLIFALFITLIIPILSFFGFFYSLQTVPIQEIPQGMQFLFEIIALLIQIFLLVIIIFIGVPWFWYTLVNKFNSKQIISQLKIRFDNLDQAVLWSIIVLIIGFGLFFIAGIILTTLGIDASEASNIPDIELIFSFPSIIVLLIIQPIGEEIFFRGFLMDKINSLAGKEIAIISTGLMFGIAHLSYAKIYPAIMTFVLGILLGYVVFKTKNLNTSIIAHILFNVTSITFYFLGQYFDIEALIL